MAGSRGTARRIFSDVLIVVAVALLATAAGLWVRSQQAYAGMEDDSERMKAYAKPTASGPPVIDWEALKAINPQIIGWIDIPNTTISYAVCQAENNEYYLNHTFERNYNEYGAIFMDCQDYAPGMLNRQTIVYGHHIKSGIMFKQVADFDNQAFFNSVPTIWYLTPDQTYELAPLYMYYVVGSDTTVRQFDFDTAQAFRDYVWGNYTKAVTWSNDAEKAIWGLDRILTLCTCNYINGKGRSVLVCAEKGAIEQAVWLQQNT